MNNDMQATLNMAIQLYNNGGDLNDICGNLKVERFQILKSLLASSGSRDRDSIIAELVAMHQALINMYTSVCLENNRLQSWYNHVGCHKLSRGS